MRLPLFLFRFLFPALVTITLPGSAIAASYQRTDGTIVDPILYVCCLYSGGELLRTHPYAGIDLAPSANLQGAQLASADLRGAALSNGDLRTANLTNADLSDADLAGTDLRDANMTVAKLDYVDLRGATIGGDLGYGMSLLEANMTGTVWVDPALDEVVLSRANLSSVDLSGLNATEVYAFETSFRNAMLDGSYLAMVANDADFSGASLRGAVFERIDDTPTSLTGARLVAADLSGAVFSRSFPLLPGIDVSGANFSRSVLRDAVGLGNAEGAALYDAATDFTNSWADLEATVPFDPVTAGWTFIPEPNAALLTSLGLAVLGRKRNGPNRA